jgi:protein CpxP
MKKFYRIDRLVITLALTLALAASAAIAQSSGSTPDEGGQKRQRSERRARKEGFKHRGGNLMGGGLIRRLDLTEAQREQLKSIHESRRESMAALRSEIRAKRQELRQASSGDTFNEALAAEKLSEIARLEAKLMAERFAIHQATLSILTPEQKLKLEQMREQFKSRRGGERRGRSA